MKLQGRETRLSYIMTLKKCSKQFSYLFFLREILEKIYFFSPSFLSLFLYP